MVSVWLLHLDNMYLKAGTLEQIYLSDGFPHRRSRHL